MESERAPTRSREATTRPLPDPASHLISRQVLVGWLVAIVASIGAVLIRILLQPVLGSQVFFVTAFPAVIAVTLYAGVWPGLFCLVLCNLGLLYVIYVPDWEGQGSPWPMAPSIAAVCIAALLVVIVCDRYRRSKRVISIGVARELRSEARLRASKRELQQRNSQLEAVLETAPVAIMIALDPSGKLITGNREMYNMVELEQGCNLSPFSQAVKGAVHTQAGGEDMSIDSYPIMRALRGERVRDAAIDFVLGDGRVKRLKVDAAPMRNVDGQICGAVAGFLVVAGHLGHDLPAQAK